MSQFSEELRIAFVNLNKVGMLRHQFYDVKICLLVRQVNRLECDLRQAKQSLKILSFVVAEVLLRKKLSCSLVGI